MDFKNHTQCISIYDVLAKDCFKTLFVTPNIYETLIGDFTPQDLLNEISSLEPIMTIPCSYDRESRTLSTKEKNFSAEISGSDVCKSLGVDTCTLLVVLHDDQYLDIDTPIRLNNHRFVRIGGDTVEME